MGFLEKILLAGCLSLSTLIGGGYTQETKPKEIFRVPQQVYSQKQDLVESKKAEPSPEVKVPKPESLDSLIDILDQTYSPALIAYNIKDPSSIAINPVNNSIFYVAYVFSDIKVNDRQGVFELSNGKIKERFGGTPNSISIYEPISDGWRAYIKINSKNEIFIKSGDHNLFPNIRVYDLVTDRLKLEITNRGEKDDPVVIGCYMDVNPTNNQLYGTATHYGVHGLASDYQIYRLDVKQKKCVSWVSNTSIWPSFLFFDKKGNLYSNDLMNHHEILRFKPDKSLDKIKILDKFEAELSIHHAYYDEVSKKMIAGVETRKYETRKDGITQLVFGSNYICEMDLDSGVLRPLVKLKHYLGGLCTDSKGNIYFSTGGKNSDTEESSGNIIKISRSR